MRMREAFEIRCHDTGPGKGLNEDNGAYLKTDIWDPVLKALQWCSWYVVGWGGGAHPSWVLFCPILGFSLLYPLCVSVLSLFLILLPLMMTYRVMSKILVKKKLCVFIYSTWHSILHIENKLVLIHVNYLCLKWHSNRIWKKLRNNTFLKKKRKKLTHQAQIPQDNGRQWGRNAG